MVTMKKIVTVVQPEPGSVKKPFRVNTSYRLGVTQIIIGVLCFVFHIVSLAVDAAGDRAGHGLWAGAAVSHMQPSIWQGHVLQSIPNIQVSAIDSDCDINI